MTPPLKWLNEEIKITPENAKDLTDEEMDIVVAEKQRRLSANLGDSEELKEEIEEIQKEKREKEEVDVENNQEQLNNEYLKLEKTLLSDDLYWIKLKDVHADELVLSFLENQKKMNISLETQVKNMQAIVDAYTKDDCRYIGENYYVFFPWGFGSFLLKADPQHFAEKVSIFSNGFNKIKNTILFGDGLVTKRFDIENDPFLEKLSQNEKNSLSRKLHYIINSEYSDSEKNEFILQFKLDAVLNTYNYAKHMGELAIETPIDQRESKVDSINKKEVDKFMMK